MDFDEKSFKTFWACSLNPLICEIKKEYSVVEVFDKFKSELTKTVYLGEVMALISDGWKHLNGKLRKHSKNAGIDEHKIVGLLLMALLKRPLFYVDYDKKNSIVGYYFASILFAWKAALSLLRDFALNLSNLPKGYEQYLKTKGLAMPSKKYEEETWRTLELCFRTFHRRDILCKVSEPPPFPELDEKSLASDKDWGWALIFANIFFTIEKNSLANFKLKQASGVGSVKPHP